MTMEKNFIIKDPGVFWSLQTIDQLGKYKLSKPQISEFADVYLDTKKRRLLNAGYSCRQRSQKKISLITLKKHRITKGKSQKARKWHVQLRGNKNGPDEWPKSEARRRVLKVAPDKKIRAIFTLQHIRITRLIRIKDDEVAQVILDDITVIENRKDQHFKTLKIKIPDNNGEDHIKDIAAILESQWALKHNPLTKFEHALTLTRRKK